MSSAAKKNPDLIAYRHRWFDALLVGQQVEAVVTLGGLAAEAWQLWKATPNGQAATMAVAAITHPTQPESSSKGDKTKLAGAIKAMLKNWNAGLQLVSPAIQHPDQAVQLLLYGDTFQDGERVPIPEEDMPAGLPAWMHENDGWARRVGADDLKKRANITVTVPKEALP